MRKTNRVRDNIIKTIENWGATTYTNPILNMIWKLIPGFIVWQIWKERNRCIFHSDAPPLLTSGQIFSKMYRKPFVLSTGPKNTFLTLLKKLSSSQIGSLTYQASHPTFLPTPLPQHPTSLLGSAPMTGYVKLNFDGASKGNPGASGFGVVL
jgi:hypothetical protein